MTCPGVGLAPTRVGWINGFASPRGTCPCCSREYALRVGARSGPWVPWVLRHHTGLPKRPDGGCPYRCPPDCDFDCYFPEEPRP